MMDAGAMHSFMAEMMVNTLDFSLARHSSHIKTINSQIQAMRGMAFDVQVVIDGWYSKMDLMVVPLDNFDLIVNNDFFVVAKMAILLYLFGLLIGNEKKPCFIAGHSIVVDANFREFKIEMVSVM